MEEGRISLAVPAFHLCPAVSSAAHPVLDTSEECGLDAKTRYRVPVKIQLLPSSFDEHGIASLEQRLSCYVVDDCVAIDAGSVALAVNNAQRGAVRDIIITHPHIDHIATLPIFIDDVFATLQEPVRIHATADVITLLERDIFNWTVYPRFTELSNDRTRVMEYVPFRPAEEFAVKHLKMTAIPVNHSVPTVGLIFSDGETTVGFSSDTGTTENFWHAVNRLPRIDALLIEASFPTSLQQLAVISGHHTPASLRRELHKLIHTPLDILVVHLKPAYREMLVRELVALDIPHLSVMQPGREYSW
ncbi:MAG: 3',5'-cyclic-nucleotide phosphodiesterase [Acidobacteriota bacterium]|nr:3',5'-cyclic-nucleotide phosphodiesterase [Acidobacteriota bacterium]